MATLSRSLARSGGKPSSARSTSWSKSRVGLFTGPIVLQPRGVVPVRHVRICVRQDVRGRYLLEFYVRFSSGAVGGLGFLPGLQQAVTGAARGGVDDDPR